MDNFLNGLTLLGIPAIVLVPIIVQALKTLGLPNRWAGVAAITAGLIIAALIEAVAAWPTITPIVRTLIAGILLGLAAAGSYSQYRDFKDQEGVKRKTQNAKRKS
jgi:ABC-type uncharacterized transport system permease subunit